MGAGPEFDAAGLEADEVHLAQEMGMEHRLALGGEQFDDLLEAAGPRSVGTRGVGPWRRIGGGGFGRLGRGRRFEAER